MRKTQILTVTFNSQAIKHSNGEKDLWIPPKKQQQQKNQEEEEEEQQQPIHPPKKKKKKKNQNKNKTGLQMMHSLRVLDALEPISTPFKFVLCVELTV